MNNAMRRKGVRGAVAVPDPKRFKANEGSGLAHCNSHTEGPSAFLMNAKIDKSLAQLHAIAEDDEGDSQTESGEEGSDGACLQSKRMRMVRARVKAREEEEATQ